MRPYCWCSRPDKSAALGRSGQEQFQSLQSEEGIWAEDFGLKWSTTFALGSQKGQGRFRDGGRHASQTSATWLTLSVTL
jgi:hypothetical protein